MLPTRIGVELGMMCAVAVFAVGFVALFSPPFIVTAVVFALVECVVFLMVVSSSSVSFCGLFGRDKR